MNHAFEERSGKNYCPWCLIQFRSNKCRKCKRVYANTSTEGDFKSKQKHKEFTLRVSVLNT